MSSYKELTANTREVGKKSLLKTLIKGGFIPAVIYIKGNNSIPVSFKKVDMDAIVDDPSAMTRLYDVNLEGKKMTCLLKEVQFNPANDTIRSADFMEVHKGDIVKVNIPIRVLNKDICPGVKNGGDIYLLSYNVDLKCNVDKIPYAIEIDVKNCNMGKKFFLSDIDLPSGCKLINDVILLRIAGKRTIKEEVVSESSAQTSTGTSEPATSSGTTTQEGATTNNATK